MYGLVKKTMIRNISIWIFSILIAIYFVISTISKENHSNMPKVEQRTEKFTVHGIEMSDPYKWLRDKNWPEISDQEILSYVKAENEFSDKFFKQKADLLQKIFQEIKAKTPIKDYTVPYKDDKYFYYSYILENDQYWNHARRLADDGISEEEVIKQITEEINSNTVGKDVFLNCNKLAEGSKFFTMHTKEVSPSHELVAYSVDYEGNERYNVVVQEIDTGKVVDDKVKNTMGDIIWHQNGKGFFYIPSNEFWRSERVMYHEIGSDAPDIEIFHEKDYTFEVGMEKSSSNDFLFINSSSYTSTESKYLDLRETEVSPEACKFVFARKPGHIFSVAQNGNFFYILTNDMGDNFRLVKMDINDHSKIEELLAHNLSVPLTTVVTYKENLVIENRKDGLQNIAVYSINQEDGNIQFKQDIKFDEPSYDAVLNFTTFDSGKLRYKYSSFKTPGIVFEYDFNTAETNKLKEIKFDGFNPDDYEMRYETLDVPAVYFNEEIKDKNNIYLSDNVKAAVTIIYKKSQDKGPKPLYLHGYGSYGITISTNFRPSIFPMLDRGFVFAEAHIRGGGEFGRMWYEAGKLGYKRNTFEDFIKVAEYLKDKGYASSIAIEGGSAGGILIGYCINNRPDLFKAAVTQVPFVDVVNTMLDDTLPLTPLEFKEWGNPITDKSVFEYLKSYSPYDNIKDQEYPHLYISSGLHDQRVTYWEPLKFVAKLRPIMDDKMLFLQMNMNAGHRGSSGRFDHIYDVAKEDVFVLTAFGKDK